MCVCLHARLRVNVCVPARAPARAPGRLAACVRACCVRACVRGCMRAWLCACVAAVKQEPHASLTLRLSCRKSGNSRGISLHNENRCACRSCLKATWQRPTFFFFFVFNLLG